MWYEDYLKKHPYLTKQVGIGAVSVITFAVLVGEHKLEAEHRFYRDDLSAHVYFYDSPATASFCVASGSGTSASVRVVHTNYNKESVKLWPAISGDSINL